MYLKSKLLILLISFVVISGCGDGVNTSTSVETGIPGEEQWPHIILNTSQKTRQTILYNQQSYISNCFNPAYREAYSYNSYSHYLGYGIYGSTCQNRIVSGVRELDQDGVMMMMTSVGFRTTPVLSAQCGMQLYFFENRTLTDTVNAYVANLMASQDESGAYRFDFPLRYGTIQLEAGWPSGMAQGQTLSFFLEFSRIIIDRMCMPQQS